MVQAYVWAVQAAVQAVQGQFSSVSVVSGGGSGVSGNDSGSVSGDIPGDQGGVSSSSSGSVSVVSGNDSGSVSGDSGDQDGSSGGSVVESRGGQVGTTSPDGTFWSNVNEGGGSGNDSGSVSGDVSVVSGGADGSSGGVVGGSGGTGGVSVSVSGGSSEENNADVDFFSGVRRLFGGGDNSDVDSVVPDNDSDVVPEGEVTVSLTQNEEYEIAADAEFNEVLGSKAMSPENKISTLTTILKNTKANEVKYNMGNENSNEMANQLAKLYSEWEILMK